MTAENEPAFPRNIRLERSARGTIATDGHSGLTAREHACIALRVPESGTPWLDDKIRKARRTEIATAALPGVLEFVARGVCDGILTTDHGGPVGPDDVIRLATKFADGLLAEGEKSAAPE